MSVGIEWVKVSVNTFDDQKVKLIRSMPDGDTMALIWMQLILEAGKVNEGGVVRLTDGVPYSDEMLATVLGHPIGTVRLAINTFAKFGMVSVEDDGIWLMNWDKYQNTDAMARIREQGRLRAARHREKRKLLTSGNATVTLRNAIEVDEEGREKKEDNTTATPTPRTECNVTSLLSELTHLPGWAESKDNHDQDWLMEFTSEYPLTIGLVRACRDYHSDKSKQTKGLWKTRLRNWMKTEGRNGNGNNGWKGRTHRNPRELPKHYDATPSYNGPA